ncbi:EF-hand calcium-binding domain-containing protein 6 [Tautogolabrus adspersus]
MPRPLPLQPGLGPPEIGWRPHTAPSSATHTSRRGLEQPWSRTHTGQQLTLQQVEPLIRSRTENMKSAFMAVDPDGTGLVSKEEFRRVLESLLPVFRKQLHAVINQVCAGDAETVDYLQFLRSFSRAPVARRASSSRSSARRGPLNTPMTLSEIQKHLKEKIGGNLKNMIRVFRLFDYNRGGCIQQHELRRILDNYCIRLTDKEFQRLWNHYSPNNSSTISYELFLETLGFGDSHNFRISPVCTKLEVCSRGKSPPDQVKHKKQTPGDPSVLPLRKLETLFHDKMCVNSTSVWQALQAFDTTRSGLVTQEVLRAVLSSFIFPMNLHSLQKLASRYGVRETGLLRWKHFMGHFMSSVKEEEEDTNVHNDRVSQPTAHDEDKLPFQDLYPKLKEVFLLLDQKEAARVTRADLRHLLERPVESQAQIFKTRLRRSQITELLNVLDPEHTGIIQLADLERLNPSDATPAPTDNTVTPPANHTAETRDVPKETEDTDATVRRRQQSSEGQGVKEDEVDLLLTTAQRCLAAMKTRIKTIHGDNLAAFHLMDRRRRGVVDCHDFKKLYDSLGFFCREDEYERLLDLIGLHPGGNLNYAEFVDVLENNGKRKQEARSARVQRQLHELLSSEARYRWTDMSKILCQSDSDGQCWIHKNSLRRLLFTYSLPLTSEEFDRLWLRLKVSMDDDWERLSNTGFLSAFEKKSEKKSERPPSSPDALRQIECLDHLSPGAALVRMRDLVTASAPNLFKAFSAFDQSRTGTLTALEFRQVLESFCARLSDKQFRHMLTTLELDRKNCTVNWRDFLNKFQSKSPPISTETCSSRTKTRPPLHTKTPDITDHLKQTQEVVSDHLHDINRELLDLDSSQSAPVSKEQLRQICDRRSLRLTDDQLQPVWSEMPPNEEKKLQYREFQKCFGTHSLTLHPEGRGSKILNVPSAFPEPRGSVSAGAVLQRTQSAPQFSSRRPASAGRPGTGSPAGSVERRLRVAVQRCWKEIQKSCREEDPQKEGLISTSCFLKILQSLSISVPQRQFELLAVKFDIMTKGCVSYHDFLRHFLLNLKPAETMTPFQRRRLPLPTQTSQGVLSRSCVDVMLRIYDVIRSSWTSIRRCFLASNRARTGSVSVQDFRKVLRHFRVSLSEEEFFHLSSFFDADTTGKICYDNFLWTFLH